MGGSKGDGGFFSLPAGCFQGFQKRIQDIIQRTDLDHHPVIQLFDTLTYRRHGHCFTTSTYTGDHIVLNRYRLTGKGFNHLIDDTASYDIFRWDTTKR